MNDHGPAFSTASASVIEKDTILSSLATAAPAMALGEIVGPRTSRTSGSCAARVIAAIAWPRSEASSTTVTFNLSAPRKPVALISSAANLMPSDAGAPTKAPTPVMLCRMTMERSAASPSDGRLKAKAALASRVSLAFIVASLLCATCSGVVVGRFFELGR